MSKNEAIDYLQIGVEKGLIQFSDEGKRIKYIEQNTSRLYTNPEEQIQAEAYCRLILEYGYPKHRVQNFVTVPMDAWQSLLSLQKILLEIQINIWL